MRWAAALLLAASASCGVEETLSSVPLPGRPVIIHLEIRDGGVFEAEPFDFVPPLCNPDSGRAHIHTCR